MTQPEEIIFESRAKLMVSGEYLVLKGALSLALPLKFGQKLSVQVREGKSMIVWNSMIQDKPWFTATIQLPDFRVTATNLPEISETLRQILMAAKKLNPDFLQYDQEYLVTAEMDFNPAWGIGSSSSLISNIADWAGCDPFILNSRIFNGSGYDIACARSTSPIIYRTEENRPFFRPAYFQPHFHRHLYFVYLNRKQDTRKSIGETDLSNVSTSDIETISGLTLRMEATPNLMDFQSLMDLHEEITGKIIHKTPVRQLLFNDFPGSIKSLGSWGGDFILAVSDLPEVYVRNYFTQKNLTTIFNYNEIVSRQELADHSLLPSDDWEHKRLIQNLS